MTDTPTLRQTERDLYAAAEELRTDDLADVKARIAELESQVQALDDDDPTPDEWEAEYQQLKEQGRETIGTAESYDFYAVMFDGSTNVTIEDVSDYNETHADTVGTLAELVETDLVAAETVDDVRGDSCVFVLEELNGDEWAATIDAVRAEGQRNGGTVPEGHGRVTALEYGVEDIPDDANANPGAWPAPIINELFEALEDITAPEGVELGNDSLASVRETTPDATDARDTTTSPTVPGEASSPE